MSPEPSRLPDQPKNGSKQVLATLDNVQHLIKDAGIRPRYNVIKKRLEIAVPDHQGTADNLENATMTTVVSLAAQLGMPTSLVPEYVNAIGDRDAYNPVADWILSKPWDGVSRLPDIIATVVTREGYPDRLKNVLMTKWLLSAVAAALKSKGFKTRGVLTLQGPQGTGKTSWAQSLVSDLTLRNSVIKLDHHMDGSNKDSLLGAITNWIVEFGELESSFRKDVAKLKGFITADSDRVRKPYARAESEYPRRTVFLATVNDANFLVDTTGNTRWWTIPVERLDFNHGIDMQQLFAELAVQFRNGGQWWLTTAEEAELEEQNNRHRTISATADIVRDALDLDRADEKLDAWTATEVLMKLQFRLPISNANAKECAAVLRELLGSPKRINGREKWRVPFREPAPDTWKKPTASDEIDPNTIF